MAHPWTLSVQATRVCLAVWLRFLFSQHYGRQVCEIFYDVYIWFDPFFEVYRLCFIKLIIFDWNVTLIYPCFFPIDDFSPSQVVAQQS